MANAMPITLARIIGAYLLLTAIAVFVLLIITPLIHDGSPDYPYWQVVNYFMALGALADARADVSLSTAARS